MRLFKTIYNNSVDIVKHTREMISKNPNVKLHIGTDSQNIKKKTIYVTVLAYDFGDRGVHYIYTKQFLNKITNKFERLFKETEMTIGLADYMREQIQYLNIELDFDFNKSDKYFSQKLIPSSVGWAQSLGYKTNVKTDDGLIATFAADHHCK